MSKVISVSGAKVEVIKDLTKNDNKAFVYLDPPYYLITKNVNKLYGQDFKPVNFLKLRERCDELTVRGIPFVLTNSDCEFIRVLFRDYPIVGIKEPRVMGQGKGKGSRPKVKCLIITNFKNKKDFMGSINQMNNLMEKN